MKFKLPVAVVAFLNGWIFSLLIAILIATSIKSSLADWNTVPTGSMKPTIIEGDRIFVNKLAYDLKVPYTTIHMAEWGSPERGEIVVFYSPEDGKRLVKRVIGVPGDTISMEDSKLYINGKPLTYRYPEESDFNNFLVKEQYRDDTIIEYLNNRIHPVLILSHSAALSSFNTKTIPEGKYYMMGDNRYNSADSRYFGFVDRKLIVGRATAIVISLDINDMYKPRFERFFERLP
ncbi:MAG: signal peptidase I [Deltaproteobacteria bacterium]|nr:signal peptidase I [Deltaproteobacteria bacterium]